MSLHVQMNQRLLKTQAGENSPASPGMIGSPSPVSPMSMAPSSPQGMPIPRRIMNQEAQHWNQNPISGGNFNVNVNWNALNLDAPMDAMEVPSAMNPELEQLSMEGELSKLSMAVDDDDIFKVEKNDLLGPTLAELNAADADNLLDGLNFADLYWPADSLVQTDATPSPQTPGGGNPLDPENDLVPFQVQPSSSFPPLGNHKIVPSHGTSVPAQTNLLEQQLAQPTLTLTTDLTAPPPPQPSPSPSLSAPLSSSSTAGGLRELLLRRELQNSLDSPDLNSPLGQSLPRSELSTSPGSMSPRLSTSAPSQGHNGWEAWQKKRDAAWQRRDPRPHMLSECGSTSSLSADVLSPGGGLSLSMDEGLDSDDMSERDSSDEESEVSDTESNAGSTSGTRRERFFWQYNVQAKGPKGQRLVLAPTQEDPHVLQKPTDPVFSPLCSIQGIKHSGKARKGDGNDLTPSPKKLWAIGKELDRLNKVIAEMAPVADLPNSVKSRSRKEKNKLASRACRLKKKAQHEANKLKLYGLEQEHKRLISVISQSRNLMFSKLDGTLDASEPLAVTLDRISKTHKIAGHTTEFVNKVLEKVKHGVPDGGISEL